MNAILIKQFISLEYGKGVSCLTSLTTVTKKEDIAIINRAPRLIGLGVKRERNHQQHG